MVIKRTDDRHAHKRTASSTVGATSVACYDRRVVKVENSHIKERHKSFDVIICAGGAYDLCARLSHRTITLFEDIDLSFEHHQKENRVKILDLYLHYDCGRFSAGEKRRSEENYLGFCREMFSSGRQLLQWYFKKRRLRISCFWVDEAGVVHRVPIKN